MTLITENERDNVRDLFGNRKAFEFGQRAETFERQSLELTGKGNGLSPHCAIQNLRSDFEMKSGLWSANPWARLPNASQSPEPDS
jgi:hypothetical protein